jgi:hypothetical protein
MATVMKCDICGAIFERDIREYYSKIQTIRCDHQHDIIDACPACTKRINGFLSGLKMHGDDCKIVIESDRPGVSQDDWEKLR